jgi:hypothetical protein
MNWKLLMPFGIALPGGVLFSLTSVYGVIGLVVLVVFFVWVVWASWWTAIQVHPKIKKKVYAVLPLILYFAIIVTDLPLRLAFTLNRTEFDRVAARVENNDAPQTPFWIGPFRIAMAGKRGGSGAVYLAANSNQWEINGFVPNPEGRGFNLWSASQLDDRWSFVVED